MTSNNVYGVLLSSSSGNFIENLAEYLPR
jgi:hypothetical protein